MADDRKTKSVGFLFFIVHNVIVYGALREFIKQLNKYGNNNEQI